MKNSHSTNLKYNSVDCFLCDLDAVINVISSHFIYMFIYLPYLFIHFMLSLFLFIFFIVITFAVLLRIIFFLIFLVVVLFYFHYYFVVAIAAFFTFSH